MNLPPELARPRKPGAREAFVRYAVAVCSVAASVALRFALGSALGSSLPYITFFPAIMLAAWFGGLGPGILATVLSLVAVFSFALEPLRSAGPSANASGVIVFVVVSVFISMLNEALRRSLARSDERSRQLASAEKALAESKRAAERQRDLLHVTLSSIGDAVITTDAQGRVTFLNAVAQDLTGWSQADAAGKMMPEVFVIRNEKTGLPVESPVEKAIREGIVIGIANHTVLMNKNGRAIPIEDSASPIRDEQQRILGVALVFRDVTGRRHSENAVKRSEERLKLALDAGKIGVWDWDVVQNRIEWSDLVYDIHGVERGTFPGAVEDFAELIHPDDRTRVNGAIADALRHGVPYDIEFRAIHSDGTVHWVSTMAQVFRNEEDLPTRMLGAVTDVTARKEAEEGLRKSEERLTLALEAGGGVGAWDWDIREGRVYSNPQFAKLYSVDPEHAAGGAPIAEFLENVHQDDRGRVDESIRRAMETGGDFAEEYRVVQRDGVVRWVHARGRCHLDEAGNPVRFPGVIFEITGLKRAEEDLLQSNEELKRVNRELEEFAYVASHDLQEPLRTVNIYAQLLLRDIGPEQRKLGQYASFIQHGVIRMEALIRDLLTFSRSVHAEEPPVGTANLSASFAEALSVLKDEIERSAAVITAEPLPSVRGDVSQLAHVFQNLLSNALKYRKNDVPPEIRVSAEPDDGRWIISVRDNGIGFEPRYADRIFGLFKRLHTKEYAGTGLGLAICKRIVERYGGRIWAESRPGEGAAFHFSLLKETTEGDM